MRPKYFFLYEEFLGYGPTGAFAASVGSAALFLFLTFVFWPLTRPTSPESINFWSRARKLHNVAIFLFSLVTAVVAGGWLYLNGHLSDFKTLACEPIPDWMWSLNYIFIFSKVWEWADSMFLVYLHPDRPKTFLHVYHHTTTFWLFLNMADLPGMLKVALFLNSAVHAIMYAHYAWPFPKTIVPLITTSQILQLSFGTWVWHVTPATCPQFADFPKKYPAEFITPYCFAPVYIVLFVHFFWQRFVMKKPKGDNGPKKKVQ